MRKVYWLQVDNLFKTVYLKVISVTKETDKYIYGVDINSISRSDGYRIKKHEVINDIDVALQRYKIAKDEMIEKLKEKINKIESTYGKYYSAYLNTKNTKTP